MKRFTVKNNIAGANPAAFRRLCVETGIFLMLRRLIFRQPPSGGCVLKLFID